MADLLTAFLAQLANATPTIVGVIGAVVGLVFLLVIGRFIISRVRGSVK